MPNKLNYNYTPFIDEVNGGAGFKCTRDDGYVEYVYLIPSSVDVEDGDDYSPNLFLYQSTSLDPNDGGEVSFTDNTQPGDE